MIVLVTKKEGGVWYSIENKLPPYKAILFLHDRESKVWDCKLRCWR